MTPDVQRLAGLRAVLFDLDGVLTPTAEVHMRAWDRMFNDFLPSARAAAPYTDADYFAHVDGKPRFDGVRAFLASRGIELPEGTTDDAPTRRRSAASGTARTPSSTRCSRRRGRPLPRRPRASSTTSRRGGTAVGGRVLLPQRPRRAPRRRPRGPVRGRRRRCGRGSRGPAGQAGTRTYLHAAGLLGRRRRGLRRGGGRPLRGRRPGRAGGLRPRRRRRPGCRARALLDGGADLVVDDLADLIPGLDIASEEHA